MRLSVFAFSLLCACGATATGPKPTPVVPVASVSAKPLPSAPANAPCSASEEGALEPDEVYGRKVRVLTVCGVPDERTQSAISAYLNYPPGREVTKENLAEGLHAAFHQTGLVRRMDVVARATSSGGVNLEIHCEPNPTIADVRVEGAPHLPADVDVRKGLRTGDFVSPATAHRVAAVLRYRYVADAFEDAEVEPVILPAGNGSAYVLLKVNEGRRTQIGKLTLAGVSAELEGDMRKLSQVAPAAPLGEGAEHEARRAVERFYADRGWLEANVDIVRGERAADATVPVTIAVKPGARYRIGKISFDVGDAKLEKELRELLRVRTGEIAELAKIEADATRMDRILRVNERPQMVQHHGVRDAKRKVVDVVFRLGPRT